MSDDPKSVAKEGAEFFMELVDKTGVSVMSVSDGYLLGFKRTQLQEMLDKNPTSEKIIIFVQQNKIPN